MKNFAKSKGKRITAALLCAVMCIMSLPLSAFAFTAEEGKTVDAYYGDKYVSADGEMYYSPSTYQYIAYDANDFIETRIKLFNLSHDTHNISRLY